jgi:segregation and condensation protein A
MRQTDHHYRPAPARAYPLEDARNRLRGKLPELRAWTALTAVAPFASAIEDDGPSRASYLASTLAAGLELVREGELEARQLEQFADLFLRARLRLEAAE